MSFTYFISDIHLTPDDPVTLQKFLAFIQMDAPQADALYILGDLFEAWIGDDDNSAFARTIKIALKKLSERIPVYFIHGNRDFIVGAHFTEQTGVQLLPEVKLINLYGRSILLLHGDLLCIDDANYQAFRKKAHDPNFQKKLLRLPLFMRRWLAAYARYRSKKHTQSTDLMIQDVTQDEVRRYLAQYPAELLIHGHTHRPAEHHIEIARKMIQRVVLAAWHDYGEALKIDSNGHISRYQF